MAKWLGPLFRRGEILVLISAQKTARGPDFKELLEFRDVGLPPQTNPQVEEGMEAKSFHFLGGSYHH